MPKDFRSIFQPAMGVMDNPLARVIGAPFETSSPEFSIGMVELAFSWEIATAAKPQRPLSKSIDVAMPRFDRRIRSFLIINHLNSKSRQRQLGHQSFHGEGLECFYIKNIKKQVILI